MGHFSRVWSFCKQRTKLEAITLMENSLDGTKLKVLFVLAISSDLPSWYKLVSCRKSHGHILSKLENDTNREMILLWSLSPRLQSLKPTLCHVNMNVDQLFTLQHHRPLKVSSQPSETSYKIACDLTLIAWDYTKMLCPALTVMFHGDEPRLNLVPRRTGLEMTRVCPPLQPCENKLVRHTVFIRIER